MKSNSPMPRHHGMFGAAAVAVFLLLAIGSAEAVAPRAANTHFIYGDVDGNGAITITDAELALQSLVGLAPPDLRADIEPVNPDGSRGDGTVGLADVMAILRTAVGLEPVRTASFSLIADTHSPIAAANVIGNPGTPLRLTVENSGSDPARIEYSNADQVDFAVFRGDNEIWHWSRHQSFDDHPTSVTLLPGQPRVFSAWWDGKDDQGNPAPAGQYEFRGELPSANGGLLTSDLAPMPTQGGGSGGLVVELTTDQADYHFGQPVIMTLTETNTSSKEIQVYIGCPVFYDFWVTAGGQEIWRGSRGQLACLAIGIGVLHPGESRHFTEAWNGQVNEGTPPPVSAMPTYLVHAQIREPDNGVISPPAVTIEFGNFVPANYFPLALGSIWSYVHQGVGKQPSTQVKQTVTGTQVIDGHSYYIFDHYIGTDDALFREDAQGNLIQHTSTGETTRYELNALVGQQWKYQPNGATVSDTATMISRNAELDTPYGHLTNLLKIAFMTGVDTSEVDYLAPGIGLVGVDNRVDVLNIPTLRLAGYEPAASVAFPLKVGDKWTYSDGFVPTPIGTAALAIQSIVGTDTAGDKTYFLFDQYEDTPKLELREDADGGVWQRTPDGETQRYLLNAAEGQTWLYAPDPNSARWNARMISRNASLDTPYGPLTGLLEIGFMGVDAGWTDYIAPGIGLVGHDTYVAPRPPRTGLRLVSFTLAP